MFMMGYYFFMEDTYRHTSRARTIVLHKHAYTRDTPFQAFTRLYVTTQIQTTNTTNNRARLLY